MPARAAGARVLGGIKRLSYAVLPAMPWVEQLQQRAQRRVSVQWEAVEDAEVLAAAAALDGRPQADVVTVIATYRRRDALRAAVASALAQPVADHLVVVVDDGGGEVDLRPDPRLRVVRLHRNTGILGLVRNVGIRSTHSRLIAFLDDDNTWTEDHLQLHLQVHEREIGLSYSGLSVVDDRGRPLTTLSRPFDRRRLAHGNYVDSNAMVVRRTPESLFTRLRRPNPSWRKEDWELAYRISARSEVRHVPVPTVRYLKSASSWFSAHRVPTTGATT